ncbi:Choline O-acetyltransferase, partial [Gryllus bimaculatus]
MSGVGVLFQAYDWWLHDMYLNNQLPLPVNSNPGMVLPPRAFSSADDAARFAARLIMGVVEHKAVLDRLFLKFEMYKVSVRGEEQLGEQLRQVLREAPRAGAAAAGALLTPSAATCCGRARRWRK